MEFFHAKNDFLLNLIATSLLKKKQQKNKASQAGFADF